MQTRSSFQIESQSERLEDAARKLENDGYSIVSGCLSDEACDAIGKSFADDCYGLRELLTLESIQKLACSSQVRSLARAVVGEGAFAISGTFFNKTPSANWKVPWHQDRMIKVNQRIDIGGWGPWSMKGNVIHVQPPDSIMARVLAIRIHLDDCPADNGALRVMPGSHRHGYLTSEQSSGLLSRPEAICAASKGDVLLMRPLLLHSSSPSHSAQQRRVIHLEFASDDLPQPLEWRYRVS